jgi:ferrous iron transport protein B
MDVAESKGYSICVDTLRSRLNVPIVETIATQKVGMDDLKKAIQTAARNPKPSSVTYPNEVEEIIADLVRVLKEDLGLVAVHPPRWMAIKLIEGDQEVTDIIATRDIKSKIEEVLA